MPCVPACAGCRSSHLHSIAFEHFLLIVAALSRCFSFSCFTSKGGLSPTHCARFHLARGHTKPQSRQCKCIAAQFAAAVVVPVAGQCKGAALQRREALSPASFARCAAAMKGVPALPGSETHQGNPTSWRSAAQKFHHSTGHQHGRAIETRRGACMTGCNSLQTSQRNCLAVQFAGKDPVPTGGPEAPV